MKTSILPAMLAIHCDMSPIFPEHDLAAAQRFRLAANAGFHAVMLSYGDDFGVEFRREDYPARARACGLGVVNLHAPFSKVNCLWEDTSEGQRVFDGFLRCVDDCAAYGIPTLVMHSSLGEAPHASKIGMERFARLIDRAEQNDVNIALENMRRASQMQQAAFLLEHFDSPHLGICFDSGHYHTRFLRTAEADWLARFGHRLMALHLHDNEGEIATANEVDQHRLPFDGTIDWPALMRAIAATGYAGPTALEVVNLGYETLPPKEFLTLAYDRAVRLDALRLKANI